MAQCFLEKGSLDIKLRLFALFLIAAAVLALVAMAAGCGDDEAATSGGRETAAPTITETATPISGATAEGFRQFTSSGKGYSISYPETWSVQEDAASVGGVSGDAFSAPAEDAGTPNVNVLCSPIPKGTTTEDLYAALGTDAEVVGQVSLEGVSLDIVDTKSRDEVLDYAQVAVAEGECSWVITLTTSEGSRGEYLDEFIEMVTSFQPE